MPKRENLKKKYDPELREKAIKLLRTKDPKDVFWEFEKKVPLKTLRKWRWKKIPIDERPALNKPFVCLEEK